MTQPDCSERDSSTGQASAPDRRSAYVAILDRLFWDALATQPFSLVCTLLRVGGMAGPGWDPFEEVSAAFDDYNWILSRVLAERDERASRRVGLLMYCQAVEMTAPYEMLGNLIRCVQGQHYVTNCYSDLGRRSKKKLFSYVPPSAKQKVARLTEWALTAGRNELADGLDRVFNDALRNSFVHSDYIITTEHYRYTEGGLAQQIAVGELDTLIVECFAFYGAFLMLQREWRKRLSELPSVHKWPNYDVLELLTEEPHGLVGFHVHFSNGSRATYTRRPTGIEAINLSFESDGGINFFVGLLDELQPVWKINGVPISDQSPLL